MLSGIARTLIVAAAALWLAGCTTSNSFSNLFGSKSPSADAIAAQASADASEPQQSAEETTGTVPPPPGVRSEPGLLGSDPNDELSLGKKHYRANDYGLAEKYFRRAVEIASARCRGLARAGRLL